MAKPGVLGNSRAKLTIDQSIATGRELTERKPDLHVRLVDRKEIWIFEGDQRSTRKREVQKLTRDMQREAICGSVKIIRRHMAVCREP